MTVLYIALSVFPIIKVASVATFALKISTMIVVMNLVGGWAITGLIIAGQPKLRATAVQIASEYARLPAGRAFALAILGGLVITLMTWMERATESVPAKLVAAVSAAFLLVAGTLNHAIVVSLLTFAALHAGAPFGYLLILLARKSAPEPFLLLSTKPLLCKIHFKFKS